MLRIKGKAALTFHPNLIRLDRFLNIFFMPSGFFGGDLFQPAAAVELPRRCMRFQKRIIFAKNLTVKSAVTATAAAVSTGMIPHIRKNFHGIRIVHPFPFPGGMCHCCILLQDKIQPRCACKVFQSGLVGIISLCLEKILQHVPGFTQTDFTTAVLIGHRPQPFKDPRFCNLCREKRLSLDICGNLRNKSPMPQVCGHIHFAGNIRILRAGS